MRDPLSVVMLPDPDGPGIPLRPSLDVWREIEARHGPVGDLFASYRVPRPNVTFYHDLLFRCAKAAGHTEDFATFGRRLYALGVVKLFAVVGQLFEDLFKEPAAPAATADPDAEPPAPLA